MLEAARFQYHRQAMPETATAFATPAPSPHDQHHIQGARMFYVTTSHDDLGKGKA
jgi:hypothetical protein